MPRRVHIADPASGLPHMNLPAFDAAGGHPLFDLEQLNRAAMVRHFKLAPDLVAPAGGARSEATHEHGRALAAYQLWRAL